MSHTEESRFVHRDDIKATFDRLTGNIAVLNHHIRPKSPLSIDIAITKYCEGGCAFCYQDATTKGLHADIDYIINGLKNIEPRPFQVTLGGGEPTAHPDFHVLVLRISDLGISVSTTVGPGVTRQGLFELYMCCQNHISAVGVSLDPKREDIFVKTVLNCIGKARAHLVLKREWLGYFAEKLKTRWIPYEVSGLVLLLPKPVGRGKGIIHPSVKEIQEFFNDAVIPWYLWYDGEKSVSVDPCIEPAIPVRLSEYVSVGEDAGFHSMYWDAVEKKVSRCSFLKDEELHWDGSKEQFDNIWKNWKLKDRCKYRIRVDK